MPYKVKASFTEDGEQYEAGQIYENQVKLNKDLMEKTEEKVNAQVPEKKAIMTKDDIKQK